VVVVAFSYSFAQTGEFKLENILRRVVKALVLGGIMYFSLRKFNFSENAALTFSLVPALLGSLNILTRLAYTMTGLFFIGASGITLLQEKDITLSKGDAIEFVRSFLPDGKAAPQEPIKKPDARTKPVETQVVGKP
jgi:uncharacterized membrane protein YuzA (DUF378 family)